MGRTCAQALAGFGILAALVGVAAPARAAEPTVAVLPATGEGIGADTLEVVGSVAIQKVDALGYAVVDAGKEAERCTAAPCPEALDVGKTLWADTVVAVHLVRQEEEVLVRLLLHDVASGISEEVSGTSTPSGVLARVVGLLKKGFAKLEQALEALPGPEVEPEPVVVEPEPVVEISGEPADPRLKLLLGVWKQRHRDSIILISAGTAITAAGLALTIASAVLWKQFDDWKDRNVDSDCVDCFSKGVKKLKVNAALTALAIAHIVPGPVTLVVGLLARKKAGELREELNRLVPEMAFSGSPAGECELVLTWRF
jgi:hypothetical protein